MIVCRLEMDRGHGTISDLPPGLSQRSPLQCAKSQGAVHSRLAQRPRSGFHVSQDKCWLGNKETPLLPTSCETASILACSLLPRSVENIFEKREEGVEEERKRCLSQGGQEQQA